MTADHERYADWDGAYVMGALSRAERQEYETPSPRAGSALPPSGSWVRCPGCSAGSRRTRPSCC